MVIDVTKKNVMNTHSYKINNEPKKNVYRTLSHLGHTLLGKPKN
jgi:hypothetical protein